MTWSPARIAVAVGIAAVAVGAVVLGTVAARNDQPRSRAGYQDLVVTVRDRMDFALARIGMSQSPDELIDRIADAGALAGAAADELAEGRPPADLTAPNDGLVSALRAFSDELSGTADTLRDPSFQGSLEGINSVSFEQWVEVNAALGALRARGIDVPPLARH
jgi:hypothetical protein